MHRLSSLFPLYESVQSSSGCLSPLLAVRDAGCVSNLFPYASLHIKKSVSFSNTDFTILFFPKSFRSSKNSFNFVRIFSKHHTSKMQKKISYSAWFYYPFHSSRQKYRKLCSAPPFRRKFQIPALF